jgi:hypothetical protein
MGMLISRVFTLVLKQGFSSHEWYYTTNEQKWEEQNVSQISQALGLDCQ